MSPRRLALFLLPMLLLPGSPAARAQLSAPPAAAAGSLRGTVSDPSGAVVSGATVAVTDAQGRTVATGTSSGDGSYAIAGVPPGAYTLLVTAPGFAPASIPSGQINAGANKMVNATVQIEIQQQDVQVNADAPTVSVDPDANAGGYSVKGADLDALSDDPDELSNEITALGGPGAGPSGGQVYIDGFTGGQLPPKSAIREIRVNQNPYGAQFDKIGFGRVEIFTKPGSDKLHGEFYGQGNALQFNTGNPFTKNLPPYHSYQYEGELSGPVGKRASYFVSAQQRNIQDDAVVSAYRLAGEVNGDFAGGNYGNQTDYGTVFSPDALNVPQTRTNVAPRLDIQLTEKDTLRLRYEFERESKQNQGVGQFSLRSQAYSSSSNDNLVSLQHTHVFGPRVIVETNVRAEYTRSTQAPAETTPQVQVQGNQTFGGQSEQSISDHYDSYELSNLVELALGAHSLSLGGRLRATREANAADSSFNGLYTFAARTCPTAGGCPTGGAPNPCQTGAVPSTACTAYTAAQTYAITLQGQHSGQTFQQIQQAGGGPSQLVFVAGDPKAAVNYVDGALFFQDDWKAKPNLTLSPGLRWEAQPYLRTRNYLAPRLSLAYAFSKDGKPTGNVLRAGFGYFYDRFGVAPVLQAARVNGIVQQQVVIQNPTCYLPGGLPNAATTEAECAAAAGGTVAAGNSSRTPAIYRLGPNLHAPINIQESVGLDRQLTKSTTVSATYIHSHGSHALDTINANAPYAPTYDPAAGNVYQYFSEGVYNQDQLFVNFNARIQKAFSLFGFYGLNYARGDVNGRGSFPSNSLNLKQDYGRSNNDTRHRLFLAGSYTAPRLVRVSPFVIVQSGSPFNITASEDLNGDSIFNDRPSFAAAGAAGPSVITNSYGAFTTAGGVPIPINLGNGPTLVAVNLRAGKTWGFGERLEKEGGKGPGGPPPGGGGPPPGRGGGGRGPGGGGGPFGGGGGSGRRYNLNFNVQALNLLNIVNYAPPTGTIDSPTFGRSNALAGQIFSSPNGSASRRMFLQATFSF